MYILLTDKRTVAELIPDENPVFPGVPVERRYAPDFVQKLLHVPDETEVRQNWIYDPETKTFSPPPEPEPPEPGTEPEPPEPGTEPEPPKPALEERVEALETKTAALKAAVERGLNL